MRNTVRELLVDSCQLTKLLANSENGIKSFFEKQQNELLRKTYRIAYDDESTIKTFFSNHFRTFISQEIKALEDSKPSPIDLVKGIMKLYNQMQQFSKSTFVNDDDTVDVEIERTLNNTLKLYLSQK